MKQYIEMGKNTKGLWVVEVYDAERKWTEEIRSFVRKADMKHWLKTQKEELK